MNTIAVSLVTAKEQVCTKSVSNFTEVYNADYKGAFAHADADFH